MNTKKIILSIATLFSTAMFVSSYAEFIPVGEYANTINLAGYNVIHELKAYDHKVIINGKRAIESNLVCSYMLPGGPCRVNVTWMTNKENKPYRITETIRWTSGVHITPNEFKLEVINDLGQPAATLIKMKKPETYKVM